jgi:hypothetical protein
MLPRSEAVEVRAESRPSLLGCDLVRTYLNSGFPTVDIR